MFDGRYGHGVVSFQNKLWVIGGSDSRGLKSDVWSSEDGVTWSQTTANARFSGRFSHTTVVFKDPKDGKEKIWVISGATGNTEIGANTSVYKNDIWSSSNGQDWIEVTAGLTTPRFSPRGFHSSVVFTDPTDNKKKIWVIGGGNNNSFKNDVWYSENGTAWNQAINNKVFSGRYGHSSLAFDNKIWVIGGKDSAGTKNDVWYSANGSAWTQIEQTDNFPARWVHSSAVFTDPRDGQLKMWLIGGLPAKGAALNDVWSSADGAVWKIVQQKMGSFSRRFSHASLVSQNRLWLIGGSPDGRTYLYDVWAYQ